ncbi:MAG: site-specific integrase [Selenomonadales bacterium]|nr:site-specific integrase [Selenomonadales bacterium]
MRGIVVKKGKGWYVVLEMKTEDGERDRKWRSPRKELGLKKPATKKQAQELLIKLSHDLQQGTYIAPNDMTFGELLDRWLDIHGKQNLAKTTYAIYASHISKHIKPELGAIQVTKLKAFHLQQFYSKKLEGGRADKKDGGLSPATINDMHKVSSAALEAAVTWEIVAKNVAQSISPPKVLERRQQTWTVDHAQTFLSSISGHRLHPLYVLAIATGMRRGEILGLRWQDIDWETGAIHIVQSLVATPDGPIVTNTKTSSGRRAIVISEGVLEILKDHRDKCCEESAMRSRGDGGVLVFTSERGTPLLPRNLLRHFYSACERAGVPKIPFHALRHTHATIMLKHGVHPKVVSERLGHSRVGVTLDIYSHVLPGLQAEAANLADQAVLPDKNKTSR